MKFEPSDFFVLRTPLLPFDEFIGWSDGLEAPKSLDDPVVLHEAIARDRQRLRERLREIYQRPEIREALFVASPHLNDSFQVWEQEPESERGRGIELALVRYFARMAGRATPFGLCAGCSVGKVDAQTRLVLPERARYRRHTRLDMDYLLVLCEALVRDAAFRPAFKYRPNSSLYRAAGRLRYVEARIKEKVRSYHLVAVDETDSLTQTLARARSGASLRELAAALVDDEVSLPEAEEFIGELIDSQILVPDVPLRLTGAEPLPALLQQFAQSGLTSAIADTLRRVGAELSSLDESGLGHGPELYRATARQLEVLPAKVELSRLFQVDLTKPAADVTLGSAVLQEIIRGVEVLHTLTSPTAISREELKRFRDAFVARYEAREVPFAEALDPEAGIGFPLSDHSSADGSPLLHALEFPPAIDETTRWGKREQFLLRKLSETLQSGADEIRLDPRHLEEISSQDPLPLPDAFSVTATVAARSEAALARGDFRVVLLGATGPSGARLLGRFCHADEELHREVRRHLEAEEALRPDAIFAEIVHLPEGRLGNILARPVLRGHEIPYLGCAGSAAECQIPIADLRLSVREGKIILRSHRLQREVIPRLTSAHNFRAGGVGAYRFLCMLQGQGVAENLGWSWGPLRTAPFLPRVVCGPLVLSRASWVLQDEEVKPFASQSGAALFRALNAWRKTRRIPRLVLLAEADHELPIDFDNVLSLETFVSLVKAREQVSLGEMLPAADELCARGPEGRFVHELIIPFVRKDETRQIKELALPARESRPSCIRSYPPGSEWLYAKLYTGAASADYVLREVLRPITVEALRSGVADQWFFIRYADPDPHLRLRLHGNAQRLHAEVFPALSAAIAALLGHGRVWRMQFDTYEREVERYGGPEGVELAEKIFHLDSEAVLELLEKLDPGDAGVDERWRLTLRGIDLLLEDFGFDPLAKLALLRKMRTTFAREFHADAKFNRQVGERFRKERKELEAILHRNRDAEAGLAPGFEILHRRSAALGPVIAELKACAAAGRLSLPLDELAPSFIHMHANRLLRSNPRRHELVLYEFLVRLYTRQAAGEEPKSNSAAQ